MSGSGYLVFGMVKPKDHHCMVDCGKISRVKHEMMSTKNLLRNHCVMSVVRTCFLVFCLVLIPYQCLLATFPTDAGDNTTCSKQ